ncbi:unnamed protein product [Fraxinus pennsylvanica]|uniref:Autophagy protein ATG5 UblA domain-containing protein n=1 Tax=Fraxinus pennsylvanica TaxID=56036 RepID=A0AAD2A3T3_9LAMI|nr:unnamed protein product [Fraxinus pennsylvanica]
MDSKGGGTGAQKIIWEGAIPLQIHLHDSEVTTLPNPPPALILAPRLGYLPLIVPQIKPFFSNLLPPGVDSAWFEYKGLPLKWYIPTGVLFDLLCAEAGRPWNLMCVAFSFQWCYIGYDCGKAQWFWSSDSGERLLFPGLWDKQWCRGLLSNYSFSFFRKFVAVSCFWEGAGGSLGERKVENHRNQRRLAETCASSNDDTEIMMDEQKKD